MLTTYNIYIDATTLEAVTSAALVVATVALFGAGIWAGIIASRNLRLAWTPVVDIGWSGIELNSDHLLVFHGSIVETRSIPTSVNAVRIEFRADDWKAREVRNVNIGETLYGRNMKPQLLVTFSGVRRPDAPHGRAVVGELSAVTMASPVGRKGICGEWTFEWVVWMDNNGRLSAERDYVNMEKCRKTPYHHRTRAFIQKWKDRIERLEIESGIC